MLLAVSNRLSSVVGSFLRFEEMLDTKMDARKSLLVKGSFAVKKFSFFLYFQVEVLCCFLTLISYL